MNQSQNVVLAPCPIPAFQYCFAHQSNTIHTNMSEQPHIHDCYEIYINVSGDVAFLVNNILYPVESGDIVVTRPGDVHICIYQDQQTHECFCLWLNCSEESPLLSFTKRNDFTNFIRFPTETRSELLRLLYCLKDAEDASKEPARTSYIFRILTLLSEGKLTSPERPELPKTVQQVLDYIHHNYTDLHCVDDIVDMTHVSSSTLNRWFRKYIQLSPHKYVEALKLSHAQKLLLEGCSVTEVCDQSGFTDCSRFIAIFKSKFGETPLKYQKRRSIV